jgi:hypothetical protein
VGTIPDTIHVPLMAPISRRMMIEGVQLATLFVISRSNVSHSSRFLIHPTRTQEAEAINKTT